MKIRQSVRKYETPKVEITRFEIERSLMDMETYPNEGPGEIETYDKSSGLHEHESWFPDE